MSTRVYTIWETKDDLNNTKGLDTKLDVSSVNLSRYPERSKFDSHGNELNISRLKTYKKYTEFIQ
jgi:hypothetical protein